MMTTGDGYRDPILARWFGGHPVPDHGPQFWTDLAAAVGDDRGGSSTDRSRFRWWGAVVGLGAAAAVLVSAYGVGLLASGQVLDVGPAASTEMTAGLGPVTTPPPPAAPVTTVGAGQGPLPPAMTTWGPGFGPEWSPSSDDVVLLGVPTGDGRAEYGFRPGDDVGECGTGSLVVVDEQGVVIDQMGPVRPDVELLRGPGGYVAIVERCEGQVEQLWIGSEHELDLGSASGSLLHLHPGWILPVDPVATEGLDNVAWDEATGFLTAELPQTDGTGQRVGIDPENLAVVPLP